VGRLVPRKGLDMTIKAMPKILKAIPNALYLIVGNGPDLERLNQLAKEHDVADHVRIVKNCGDADLPNYYHACDVFCMPSRYIKEKGDVEGFGIVFLEANACKKAVLGGKSGGQPDAIEDGKTGLLCNPESPEDIADKLIHLLRDPDRMLAMGEYGYERVKNHFQAHHYGPELNALLSTLDR
jgi:phosphatidylinositol alpha-1,6-mannosyltransferase